MKDKQEKVLDRLRDDLLAIPEGLRNDYFRRLKRHAYAARLDAHDAARNLLGEVSCAQTFLLVVSGRGTTDAGGKATIPVHQLLCGAVSEGRENLGYLVPIREPSFVATPHGASPAMLTSTPRLTSAPVGNGVLLRDRAGNFHDAQSYLTEIFVDVATWDHGGGTAGGVAFSWICTVEAAEFLLIGG